MSGDLDSFPCPYCGVVAPVEGGCPGCGRAPDADAIDVIRLNAELVALGARLEAARAEVTAVETRIGEVRGRRDVLASRVRAAVRAALDPSPSLAAEPPVPAVQAPVAGAGPEQAGAFLPLPPSTERRLTTLTAQNILFALGGLLLVVAAAVFTAVAWAQVGVAGRAAILAAATAAVLAVPPFAVRRGLTGAAETLAAVGLLMILLDGYAAWSVDLLGATALRPATFAAVVSAVTAAIGFGYGRLVGLPGPKISALVIAQPVFPLLAAAVHADATGWSLALSGTTAVNVAALRRVRFATSGVGPVAYLCGFVAALAAAALALLGIGVAGGAGATAAAGGALVLVAIVVTVGAVLAGHRVAQAWAAGLLTLAAGIAASAWSLRLGDDGTAVLRLSVVALVVAVAARALRSRLPEPVRDGPWISALVVAAVPALAVAANVVVAAGNSIAAAQPMLGAQLTATVGAPGWDPSAATGPRWDLVVAAVTVVLACAVLVPARFRADLALAALATTGFLVPAAFGLPWWTAAVLGMVVSSAALATVISAGPGWAALTGREARASRAARLTVTVVAATHALVADLGDAGVGSGVCAAVAVIAVGTALFVRRRPVEGKNLLGEAAMVVGLVAVAPTVWLGLIAAETSFTVQVRALFAVTVLMCLAARRIPGYEPWSTGVALLLVTSTPLWSAAGDDPAQLYAGAALILVATLRTAPLAPIAAALLAVGLLAFTAEDLAALLALDGPSTPPVSWATVAAILMTAAAAWLALSAWTAAPLLATAVPLALAAARAPWPTVPLSQVVAGLAGVLALTLTHRSRASTVTGGPPADEPRVASGTSSRPSRAGVSMLDGRRPVLLSAFGLLAAAGVAGAASRPGALLAAFALVAVAGVSAGLAGRDLTSRVTGWAGGSAALVVVAHIGAHGLAGLEPGGVALTVLAAAAALMVLAWVLATYRPREALAVSAVAQVSALVALLTAGTLSRAALIATLWAAVLAIRALRPDESLPVRFRYALGAAGCALLGWWLFLSARQAGTAELYTVPAAALALLAGWRARRSRPELPSWTAYGAALAAGFLPTLAVISASSPDEPQYARRLLLGLAGLAVLVAGALARLQAPAVCGAVVVGLTALHELAQVWDLVPRWVPLAIGGMLLVGVATTLEQRRRDLRRLRETVGRMS
ncbi:SCO7613 C-terminal domain-containing membrane protein [Actinoplanes cyaneus]|nr:hypothetical protein [Actinoplanes cyaneus]